jgi:hypothetical protein|tara:strand:- start:51 stop:1271 length:1221 start_codon:yes stop_codon:yes gene_type:complete
MKKLILLLTLIPFISFGQGWTSSEGGSAFDGKYKTSSVVGKGTNFPYTKPVLVVNKFDGEKLNFYISGGGYFQEKTSIGVLWVFDNEPDTIYSTYDWSISDDGKILFFSEFNNPDGSGKLKPVDIIEKLTLANKVTVRMKDKFGSNDIVFSLSGSTRAINFVLPKDERQKMIESAKAERVALAESEGKGQLILDELLNIAKAEKLTDSSISTLESTIQQNLGLSYYSGMGTGKNYKSISVEGELSDSMFETYGYVKVFYILEDGSKEQILGTFKVEMDAPIFIRLKEEKAKAEAELAKKQEKEKESLSNLLSKYQRDDLKNHLMDEILEKSKRYSDGFDILDVKNILITLSELSSYRKVFYNCKVEIYLNDGSIKTIDNTYIYTSGSVSISKKDLKTLGGKANIPF